MEGAGWLRSVAHAGRVKNDAAVKELLNTLGDKHLLDGERWGSAVCGRLRGLHGGAV